MSGLDHDPFDAVSVCLPTHLHDVVLARTRGVPEPAVALLTALAVIGRAVDDAVLEDVFGADLPTAVRAARARGLAPVLGTDAELKSLYRDPYAGAWARHRFGLF